MVDAIEPPVTGQLRGGPYWPKLRSWTGGRSLVCGSPSSYRECIEEERAHSAAERAQVVSVGPLNAPGDLQTPPSR